MEQLEASIDVLHLVGHLQSRMSLSPNVSQVWLGEHHLIQLGGFPTALHPNQILQVSKGPLAFCV